MDYFLARLSAFRRLPTAELASLPRHFILRKYRRKQAVFEEGDEPAAAFLLRSGLVKAVKFSPEDEPVMMEIIVPGMFFGMIAVLDKKPYPVSAIAIQDCEAYRIPAGRFEELIGRHPDITRAVYAEIGKHLRHSQTLRSLSRQPADKRIARILRLLSGTMGPDLKIRREEVAEMAGTTVETAIRVLAGFRKSRLISSGWKRITLLDPAGLEALGAAASPRTRNAQNLR
jgi:CRP-like cAMP-binding protein